MPTDICIFCNHDREVLIESNCPIAFFDSFPISEGHALVVPRRHVESIWDLADSEYTDCFLLIRRLKVILSKRFSPDGFNIGINCGEAAGQTIWHAHIHVIPRFKGDVPNPKGGVRHVIPLKAFY